MTQGERRQKDFKHRRQKMEGGGRKKKDKKTNSTSVYINDTTFVDTRCAFNLHRGKA